MVIPCQRATNTMKAYTLQNGPNLKVKRLYGALVANNTWNVSQTGQLSSFPMSQALLLIGQ
eukprot:6210124-Pleurochrysis_carterae.AAC.2